MTRYWLRPALLAACLLATGLAPAQGQGQERIVLASVVEKGSFAGRLLELIYADAFRQLHVDYELRTYPATRATVETNVGNADGEAARTYEYGALHKNLLRVEAPLLEITTSAFAHDARIHIAGLDSLHDTHYRLEYRAGYEIVHQHLLTAVPEASLSSVADSRQGLRKLVAGRTDVFIDNDETVLPLLEEEPFRNAGIYKAGVIEANRIYCYLNVQHADLALRMAEVLKKMKASGVLDRYRIQARSATTTTTATTAEH